MHAEELRKPKLEEEIQSGDWKQTQQQLKELLHQATVEAMDLSNVNHSEESQQQQQQPIPISAQFSAATIHETAAKLKLLAATGGNNNNGSSTPAPLASSTTPTTPAPLPAPGDQTPGEMETPSTQVQAKVVRYRECLKNHAANIGGNALDGCGEFMPCGEEGTLDSLRCAACDCHRNFHRREVEGEPSCDCQRNKLERKRALANAMSTPGSEAMEEHQQQGFNMSGSLSTGGMKKRFRTKFSGEQKERMFGFAEKLGWKIQKNDEAEVQQFCNEVGVKRHVLKVWMHNNKHTFGSGTRKAP